MITEGAIDQMYSTRRSGECDTCHDDRCELFRLEEDEEGEWEYCEECAEKIIRRRLRSVSNIARAIRSAIHG